MDLSKIINSAKEAAQAAPEYKMYPKHAELVGYAIEVFSNGHWCFLEHNEDGSVDKYSFKDAWMRCRQLRADIPGDRFRVVGICELTMECSDKGTQEERDHIYSWVKGGRNG